MQNYLFLPTALLALITLAGCGSMPENSRLNEARNDYHEAQNNPRVTNLAPAELKQAGKFLQVTGTSRFKLGFIGVEQYVAQSDNQATLGFFRV